MGKKLNGLYCTGVSIAALFLATATLVKTTIWFFADPVYTQNKKFTIGLFVGASKEIFKFTTETKQFLYDQANWLFTLAFLLIFIILTVKLIKTQKLFEEVGTDK